MNDYPCATATPACLATYLVERCGVDYSVLPSPQSQFVGRKNLALAPLREARRRGVQAAEPLCDISREALIRPVWMATGSNLEEASLTQMLEEQWSAGAGKGTPMRPLGQSAAERRAWEAQHRFTDWRDHFNAPLNFVSLATNRPLMWELDLLRCATLAYPLHAWALGQGAPSLAAALDAADATFDCRKRKRLLRTAAGPEGLTALALAAKWGKEAAVMALLNVASDDRLRGLVEAGDNFGATPLWHACDGGHREVVERLLQSGANVHTSRAFMLRDTRYIPPLLVAISAGRGDLVQLLCAHGAHKPPVHRLLRGPIMPCAAKLHPAAADWLSPYLAVESP